MLDFGRTSKGRRGLVVDLLPQLQLGVDLLAGRYALLEQEALDSVLPLCQRKGMGKGLIIGGPFNSGILATGPKPGAYLNDEAASSEILQRVGAIEAVCEKHSWPCAMRLCSSRWCTPRW